MRSRRLPFALILLVLALQSSQAVELGDTRAQIEARYDTAPNGDHQKGTAIYRWDTWKLEIQYSGDVAHTLIYTKLDPISDGEVNTILGQNGGISHWHFAVQAKGRTVAWTRTDGATASLDPGNFRTLTLHGNKMPAAVSSGSAATQAGAASQPAKPGAIAPAVKATPPPTAASFPARPKPVASPKPMATPPSLLHTIIETASHQKIGYFGIALIVLAIVLWVRKERAKGLAPRRQAPRPFAGGAVAGTSAAPQSPASEIAPTLENIGWQRFELLMGEVFRRKGYEVEISSGDGADGGVDLRLKKEGALALAQCKCYLSGKVTVQPVREFYGVIKAENAARGIFVNTGVYTQDALKFAEGKELQLLDGDAVRALIRSVTIPGENIYDVKIWLSEFTAHAVIKQPDCPFCQKPMALRASEAGVSFWGCSAYPQCKGTRNARVDLLGKVPQPE